MEIRDVTAGDLLYSKLHQGWCLVLLTEIEAAIEGRCSIARLKLLHTSAKKEFAIALPVATMLATLTNYEFYRDGERLL